MHKIYTYEFVYFYSREYSLEYAYYYSRVAIIAIRGEGQTKPLKLVAS